LKTGGEIDLNIMSPIKKNQTKKIQQKLGSDLSNASKKEKIRKY